jgi:hypothetical protein
MEQLGEQIEKLGAYWAAAEDKNDTASALKETVQDQYNATVSISATVSQVLFCPFSIFLSCAWLFATPCFHLRYCVLTIPLRSPQLHATTDMIRESFRALMTKHNRDAHHIFPPSKHKPDPFDAYVEPIPEVRFLSSC